MADGVVRCPQLSGTALRTDLLSLWLSCCQAIWFVNKSEFSGDTALLSLCSRFGGVRVEQTVQLLVFTLETELEAAQVQLLRDLKGLPDLSWILFVKMLQNRGEI